MRYRYKIMILFFALFAPFISNAKSEENNESTKFQNKTELAFLENNGRIKDQQQQKRSDIDFSLTSDGLNIFVSNGKIQYQWFKPLESKNEIDLSDPIAMSKSQTAMMEVPIATYRLDVSLIGANKNATLEKGEQLSYYEKFILPDNEDEVIAHTYDMITYRDVYPNIDWVIYAKNNQLKYDFIIHPGGNPADIKISYDGADDLALSNGMLKVTTAYGEITEQAPYSYIQDTKEEVSSSFNLDGNILSFNIEPSESTLVIDPFLNWATYHGGNHYDWGSTVTTDYLGNIYMAGWTYSTNNIATSGAFQDTLTPNVYGYTWYYYNGYIAKFDDTGRKLWGTYYPGFINAAVCDGLGFLYVTGWTDSIPSIATAGAHQTAFGGRDSNWYWRTGDAFLVKFNTNGSRVWGTFYGGEKRDGGTSVAYDPISQSIYLGGSTESDSNIATQGAHLDTLPPRSNAYYYYYNRGFVAKFNTSGVRQWATYYPGMVTSISVDFNGGFAIAGTTFDTAGVATTGAHQPLHSGIINPNNVNNGEGFIAQFNGNGVRQWGTYYGGTKWDWISGVDHDEANYVYVTGTTQSDVWLASTGAHKTTIGNSTYDAHLAKFSPTGTRVWGTYFGGTNVDYGNSVKVSPLNKIYINGTTGSTNGISTPDGYKTTNNGSYDLFIAEFDTSGTQTWGTYYGGPSYEYNWGGWGGGGWGSNGSHSLDANISGKLYSVSATYSTTGIATPGAFQTTHGGQYYDGFLVSFVVDTLPYIKFPFPDTLHCAGDTFDLRYGVTFNFQSGNVFSVEMSDANGSFANPTTIGGITKSDSGTITCVIPNNIVTSSGYKLRIKATNPVRYSATTPVAITFYAPPTPLTASNNGPVCEGDTIKLSVTHPTMSGVSYSWTGPNSFSSATQNPYKTGGALADTGEYIITATVGNLCSVRDTTKVVVNIIPEVPAASSNSVVCPQTTLSLFASSSTPGVSYSWTGPNSFTSGLQNPSINNATYGMAGTYYVTASRYGCTSDKDSAVVVVAITTPTPTASSNSPICERQTLDLTSTTVNGATYKWTGPNSFTTTTPNTTAQLVNANKNAIGTYYLTAIINGCESLPDSTTVMINTGPSVAIYPSPGDSICVGTGVTLVSIGSNGGTNPQLQWYKNNSAITGATNTNYSTMNVNSGDIFYCTYTSTTTCSSPATDTSIGITMVVRPIVKPEVQITVDPGTTIQEDSLVTFTATPTYGGKKPAYQWLKNGADVLGATGSIWGTHELADGDEISVKLISNDPCTNPKEALSNVIKMTVLLSVHELNKLAALHLYPNPNSGNFKLQGDIGADIDLNLEIINSVGQRVFYKEAHTNKGQINEEVSLDAQLPSGIYILKLSNEDNNKAIRFTITK